MSNPNNLGGQLIDAFRNAVTYASIALKGHTLKPFPGGLAGNILKTDGWQLTAQASSVRPVKGMEALDTTIRPMITTPSGEVVFPSNIEYLRAVRGARREAGRQRVLTLYNLCLTAI